MCSETDEMLFTIIFSFSGIFISSKDYLIIEAAPNLLFANTFNLDKAKSLLFGKGLRLREHYDYCFIFWGSVV